MILFVAQSWQKIEHKLIEEEYCIFPGDSGVYSMLDGLAVTIQGLFANSTTSLGWKPEGQPLIRPDQNQNVHKKALYRAVCTHTATQKYNYIPLYTVLCVYCTCYRKFSSSIVFLQISDPSGSIHSQAQVFFKICFLAPSSPKYSNKVDLFCGWQRWYNVVLWLSWYCILGLTTNQLLLQTRPEKMASLRHIAVC